MANFRDILSFSRIHTASLTMPVLIIAAVVAGYNVFYVMLFAVFAFTFHFTGFSMNNLADYEHDKRDPYKQHFPLVSGKINYSNAMMVNVITIMASYAYGIMLVHTSLVPVMFVSIGFFTGVAYNFTNKRSKAGPVLISFSFSMLIPFVMLSGGHHNYIITGLYTAFAFMTMMYQISISGYIKDVETPQYNMMQKMGMRLIGGQIMFSDANRTYAMGLRIVTFFMGMAIVLFARPHFITEATMFGYVLLYVMIQVVVFDLSSRMLRNQRWMRDRFLKSMSMIEILNYFSIAILFGLLYGILWVLFLLIFPIVWYVLFNRIMFGTRLFPRV